MNMQIKVFKGYKFSSFNPLSKREISLIDSRFLRKSFGIKSFLNVRRRTDRFIFNRFLKVPYMFSNYRIGVYTGRNFVSVRVSTANVGSYFSELIYTKKFGRSIHVTKIKKKKNSGKKRLLISLKAVY